MRQARQDLDRHRRIANTVDEDAEVQIARSGEHAHHAIEEVQRAEDAQELHGRMAREERRGQRPESGDHMQRILVDVEIENPEYPALRVEERRNIVGRGRKQQRETEQDGGEAVASHGNLLKRSRCPTWHCGRSGSDRSGAWRRRSQRHADRISRPGRGAHAADTAGRTRRRSP